MAYSQNEINTNPFINAPGPEPRLLNAGSPNAQTNDPDPALSAAVSRNDEKSTLHIRSPRPLTVSEAVRESGDFGSTFRGRKAAQGLAALRIELRDEGQERSSGAPPDGGCTVLYTPETLPAIRN